MPDAQPPPPPTAYSKKVCILGDFAVGKTSLVRRFVYDRFDDKYISTIGVKVSRKVVVVAQAGELTEVVMLLWDLAGSEAFNQIRTSYLRGAAGAILVCDLTRPETLACLSVYADGLRSLAPDVPMVLAANKRDLLPVPGGAPEWVAEAADRLAVPLYLSSARLGDEVEALFRHLGQMLVGATAPDDPG